MSVRVVVTGKPLVMIGLTDVALMRNLGELARERIVRRTKAGRDANDLSFKPYSRQYAIDRMRAVGHGGVDLTLTGDMLNAFHVTEVQKDRVTIGWSR